MFHPKIESILQAQRTRIAAARGTALKHSRLPKRSFTRALESKPFALIAEIKPSSPAEGILRERIEVERLAHEIEYGGAHAVSVLTESTQFGGAPENVARVKRVCGLPVLAKDFIIDEFQVREASANGADAVLLIAEFLGENLGEFIEFAREEGMDALVECFSQEGIEEARNAGAAIIGVNNRSFQDLAVEMERTRALAPLVPKNAILVAESGINSRADIEELLPYGVNAFLVGTSIMRSHSVEEKIRELLGGESHAP